MAYEKSVITVTMPKSGEILAKLKKLDAEVRNKVEKKAIGAVVEMLKRLAIAAAPVGETGHLVNSIKGHVEKTHLGTWGRVDVTDPVAHLIEFGHDIVRGGTLPKWRKKARNPKRTGKGKVYGHTQPNAFMRRVWDANADRAADELVKFLEAAIDNL